MKRTQNFFLSFVAVITSLALGMGIHTSVVAQDKLTMKNLVLAGTGRPYHHLKWKRLSTNNTEVSIGLIRKNTTGRPYRNANRSKQTERSEFSAFEAWQAPGKSQPNFIRGQSKPYRQP